MMKFGSGSYNVRDSEVMHPDTGLHRTIQCTVYFLDGTQNEFDLERHSRGQELMDKVFAHLELVEKDYFGLQFVDLTPEDRDMTNMRWLETCKSIRKQMLCPPYVLYFRVKFYVSDPSKLQEEYTRYHFYLQLRKDILENRLACPESSAALLGSYAAQSEFGDYCSEEHGDSYLDSFQVVPNQTLTLINKIKELHKLHTGQTPADAEFNFLDHAKRVEMYGVDLYNAKDAQGTAIEVGVASYGIAIFQNRQKINTFSWAKVVKISFKRKQFFVHLKTDESAQETVVGFNLNSTGSCKLLWKSCIEHHTFFRLISPPQAQPKSLFNLGSRYRYSGRTEYQTLEEMKRRARVERTFHRAGSRNSYARSTFSGVHPPSSCAGVAVVAAAVGSRRVSSSAGVSSGVGSATNTPIGSPLLNGGVHSTLSGGRLSPQFERSAALNSYSFRRRPRVIQACDRRRLMSPVEDVADTTANDYRMAISGGGGGGTPQLNRIVELADDEHRLSQSWSGAPSTPNGTHRRSENGGAATSGRKLETTLNGSVKQQGTSTSSEHFDGNSQHLSWDLRPPPAYDNRLQPQQPRHQSVVPPSVANRHHLSPQLHPFPSSINSSHHRQSHGSTLTANGGTSAVVHRSQSATSTSSRSIPPSRPPLQNGHSTAAPPPTANSPPQNGHFHTSSHPTPPAAVANSQRSSVASHRSSLTSLQQSQKEGGAHLTNGHANNSRSSPQPMVKRPSPPPIANNRSASPLSNGYGKAGTSDDTLVTIRIRPDSQGRFGFNVKGGADQNYPIIVSRVASGSPADLCLPRLNEGDQVLMINGRDVTQHSHDQVVSFIRAARESHSGQLLLTVRPNVYVGEDVEEPDFQYVPDTPHCDANVAKSDLLDQSLLLLKDSLSSGAAITQFEQLYRKKPGLTMNVCRLPENINKNRYRDVSPYDGTRVVVQSSLTGDYINANYVNMEIPASGIVNRYIAAQGPLPHTCGDFWQIVWEQLCSTVVMLTTTIERGRVKCHQYWPKLYETHDYGNLQITCLRETDTASTSSRELSIVNKQSKEERQVSQMQYVAWPDHGVPDDPKQFVQFVSQVRKNRVGSVEPVLVHCSAGVGRTGVLIMMETAMCLIEANEPVYPLDITRIMRDQRAMLIQTSSQYKFVCEAILSAYNDRTVQPLAEYQKG